MVGSLLIIGESNKKIGWVYEAPREKVKQAQQELDDFYNQDKLNDLEEAKNNELALLDERIEGWNRYLEALQERYEQWQVQEEQKLLMELTNATTEAELHQKILDDMLYYNENAAGHYDDYIGIFEDFLAEYKANLEELQRLKETELTLMSASSYLGGNGINIPTTNTNYKGVGMNMVGSWEEGKNYLDDAIKAAKRGDVDGMWDALTKRGYKVHDTGIDYGTSQEKAVGIATGYLPNGVKAYATGLENGPVTETGLAMLHGTPSNPEYVLNNDQAYNLLSNLSEAPAQELTEADMIGSGVGEGVENEVEEISETSQGSSTAGRIAGDSEGSGATMAGGVTTGEDDLGAICAYLATILNALNQLNSIETTENTQNSQLISLAQAIQNLLGQAFALMQTDYQDDLNMYTQLLEALVAFNDVYNENMVMLFERWDTNIPVIQDLLVTINDTELALLETTNGILSTLGGGFSGSYTSSMGGGSWTGRFNGSGISSSSGLSGSTSSNSGGTSSGSGGWTNEEMWYSDPNHAEGSYKSSVSSGWGGMTDYSAMHEAVANGSKLHVKDDGVYDDNGNMVHSFANGLKGGPVTYTGLAMLHGTPSEPEYVLNNDQAYNLLYNMSSARMAEFENNSNRDNGIQYIVQGDIILEGIDNPAEFWKEVTRAMGNRWNVTKNK